MFLIISEIYLFLFRTHVIYIYSLHLALTRKYLLSGICKIQKKAVSLNPKVRQTDSGQSRTGFMGENRYCFVTYLKF